MGPISLASSGACLFRGDTYLLHEDSVLPGALVHFQLQDRDVTKGASKIQTRQKHAGPGDIAQLVEYLSSENEALGSVPALHKPSFRWGKKGVRGSRSATAL